MNRKEIDLIAKALNAAKPGTGIDCDAFEVWFKTVISVKDALLDAGHINSEGRFLGIADEGINWRNS